MNIDRAIWPYHGGSESKVSLDPGGLLYRRLIIREEVEADRRGHGVGEIRTKFHDRSQVLTKHVFTLELDPIKPTGDASLHIMVDALNGMSWRVTAGAKMSRASGTLLDAGVVAEWIRLASAGPGILDDKEIDRQAQAVVGIIRRSASEELSGIVRAELRRNHVSRLDSAIAIQMGTIPIEQPTPFRDWNASVTAKWEPAVPILYVGVPLMLAVWGLGLWLLLRFRQNIRTHQRAASVTSVPTAQGHWPDRETIANLQTRINPLSGIDKMQVVAGAEGKNLQAKE